MIDTIGGTMVMVSDQKKAVDFYTNKLGFEKRIDIKTEKMTWIEVAPKNSKSTISLFVPTSENMGESYEDAKNKIGKDTYVWLNTNDIQATFKELASKNVEISEPFEYEWGMTSILKDQDGNKFTLIQLPQH